MRGPGRGEYKFPRRVKYKIRIFQLHFVIGATPIGYINVRSKLCHFEKTIMICTFTKMICNINIIRWFV